MPETLFLYRRSSLSKDCYFIAIAIIQSRTSLYSLSLLRALDHTSTALTPHHVVQINHITYADLELAFAYFELVLYCLAYE